MSYVRCSADVWCSTGSLVDGLLALGDKELLASSIFACATDTTDSAPALPMTDAGGVCRRV